MSSFDIAVNFVFDHEGGYSNNVLDDGGATNFGITESTLDRYRAQSEDASLMPLNVADLTRDQARVIYRDAFWFAVHGDAFEWPISLYLFDTAVHLSQVVAVKMLQRALWIKDDGIIGVNTVASADVAGPTVRYGFLTLRRDHYRLRVENNPSQSAFLLGWMNRVEDLWKYGEDV